MTRRGITLATAPVVPTTQYPARSNIDLVPTKGAAGQVCASWRSATPNKGMPADAGFST